MSRRRGLFKPLFGRRQAQSDDEDWALEEETATILSEPDVLAALEEGLTEIRRGETITFCQLRNELKEIRSSSKQR
jgi:hypothetical protein